MMPPAHCQQPSLARTGSDSGGGSRSGIHVRRVRRRSPPQQGWRPRLTPSAVEMVQKASDRSRGRVSWTCLHYHGARWRPEPPDRSDRYSRMTLTTAQADHY